MKVAVCITGPWSSEFEENLAANVLVSSEDVVHGFLHFWGGQIGDLLGNYKQYLRTFCCDDKNMVRPRDIAGLVHGDYLQLWQMSRVGKLLIQTEQAEGRYGLVLYVRTSCRFRGPLRLEELRGVNVGGEHLAVSGPSTDMQLYLNSINRLSEYEGDFKKFLDAGFKGPVGSLDVEEV